MLYKKGYISDYLEGLFVSVNKIQLFKKKKDCCGCGACMNICPKQAISMENDEYGFVYPKINEYECVKCGLCISACKYANVYENIENSEAYVGQNKDSVSTKLSASGGIFEAIARSFLSDGGIVVGVSLERIGGVLTAKHIIIDDLNDLYKVQGSKYVQSELGDLYSITKKLLISGKKVLFSGTPCQISGLRGFLSTDKKNNEFQDNLITVDIICHGVPSMKLFQDYIKCQEKILKGKIVDFKFRDKSEGWGLRGKVFYTDLRGKSKSKGFPSYLSSYYNMFLKSEIYRENCYSCPYASKVRVSDITLGDYWGIEEEHPELLDINGGSLSEKKGISCILLNSKKGVYWFNQFKKVLEVYPSTIEKVSRRNAQLNAPSNMSTRRKEILELYASGGYDVVESYWRKRNGLRYYYLVLKNELSRRFKNIN